MQSNPHQTAEFSAINELVERDLLHFVFQKTTAQVIVFDAESTSILAANDAFQFASNLSLRELRKLQLCDLVPDIEVGRLRRLLVSVTKRRNHHATFVLASDQSNAERTHISLNYVGSEKPSFVAFIDPTPNFEDIEYTDDRLSTAIEALSDGFVLFDKNDRLVVCNQKYRDIYRNSSDALVKGNSFEEILRFGLQRNQFDLGPLAPDEWLKRRLDAHRSSNAVAEQRLEDGRWFRIVERQTADGGRVGLRVDITHQKLQQDELRRLSRQDDLTGLLNRTGLTRRLKILASGLSGNERLSILQFDLDRFKSINNVFGPDMGDHVLKKTAAILEKIEPAPLAVGRLSADEFIVVLSGKQADDQVFEIAERAVVQLGQDHEFEGQKCQVGASVGISFVTESTAHDIKGHLAATDMAVNVAKQSGGNRVILFKEQMRKDILAQLELAKDISRGLEADEFLPFFQPQLDTSTGRVVGFEALVRWQHPQKGLVPAFEFLQAAQSVGLTEAIDDIVIEKSCQAVRTLQDWGLSQVCISVNLSFGQISDPRILQRLTQQVKKHGISPKCIHIELLESTLLDERSAIIVDNVHQLIRSGFQVELDDFGTGHAAIATLRRFQVSRIKVDRSFVQEIDKDPELQVMTSVLIDLAQKLGIDALAEGVETKNEQSKLSELGCHVAQGYLHARPMPLGDLKLWLEDRGDIARASA